MSRREAYAGERSSRLGAPAAAGVDTVAVIVRRLLIILALEGGDARIRRGAKAAAREAEQ